MPALFTNCFTFTEKSFNVILTETLLEAKKIGNRNVINASFHICQKKAYSKQDLGVGRERFGDREQVWKNMEMEKWSVK